MRDVADAAHGHDATSTTKTPATKTTAAKTTAAKTPTTKTFPVETFSTQRGALGFMGACVTECTREQADYADIALIREDRRDTLRDAVF